MRFVALALAALSVACGGPTVGDLVSQEVSLTVRAVSSDPSAVSIGEADGGAALTRAFVSASAITLLPCNEEAAPIVLEPRGYELVGETPYGERITTAVRTFCGVQLDVAPVEDTEAEGVPAGASLYVEGTDADGAPFTLSSDASFSLRLEAEDEEGFGKVPLLLTVDAATWLAGLPLSEDMSDMAASPFVDQLQAALALYVDLDDDGALDPDEEPIHTTR
ncbi:MAG: hypothetical protein EOO73_18980 [Myxococcales bacterium]|nr:MAG: hypothetical protein EOO73_18980 [Myxococcales bacterium]